MDVDEVEGTDEDEDEDENEDEDEEENEEEEKEDDEDKDEDEEGGNAGNAKGERHSVEGCAYTKGTCATRHSHSRVTLSCKNRPDPYHSLASATYARTAKGKTKGIIPHPRAPSSARNGVKRARSGEG
jgi:hypothetical protein